MAQQPDTAIQLNFKTPAGTLINLYARDNAHLHELTNQLEEHVSTIAAFEALLSVAPTIPKVFGDAAIPVPQAAPPQQAPTPSAWDTPAQPAAAPAPGAGPSCLHGARKHVTGVGAKGPWAAWFCPTPKGTPGQCAPDWIKN